MGTVWRRENTQMPYHACVAERKILYSLHGHCVCVCVCVYIGALCSLVIQCGERHYMEIGDREAWRKRGCGC